MKVITRQSLASQVVSRWRAQYPKHSDYGEDKQVILRELEAVGGTKSPDAIDAIIGNKSWTQVPDCDECGVSKAPAIFQCGEEPDYEPATVNLCGDCVGKLTALALASDGGK